MKKFFSFILAGAMVISLSACGDTKSQESSQQESVSGSAQSYSEEVSSKEQSQDEDSFAEISSTSENNTSILVAYFSYAENAELPEGVDASTTASIQLWNNELTGNTGVVANMIAEATGANLFSIQTVEKYPDSYDETIDKGQEEQSADARPELSNLPEDLDQYDVIFLGFPNWWGDMPMAIYSFLDSVDSAGKTVIPFVTSGGSGFSNSISAIRSMEPEATVQEGLSIRDASVAEAQNDIDDWLTQLGYTE